MTQERTTGFRFLFPTLPGFLPSLEHHLSSWGLNLQQQPNEDAWCCLALAKFWPGRDFPAVFFSLLLFRFWRRRRWHSSTLVLIRSSHAISPDQQHFGGIKYRRITGQNRVPSWIGFEKLCGKHCRKDSGEELGECVCAKQTRKIHGKVMDFLFVVLDSVDRGWDC